MKLIIITYFLGRSTQWPTFTLIYDFNGVFRIPCRFDLRKYPFKSQTCEMNAWFDVPMPDFFNFSTFSSNNHVPYGGRSRVGEFKVRKTYTKTINFNTSVSLFIELDPFYGYHLLNSFLTSFLILLISFATFFFRIDDFNERIMVSLTALLVLTALFTQSNSVSVTTSYLKLIDIWYAVLIICTFLSVVLNTALNAYNHHLKVNAEIDSKGNDILTVRRKLTNANFFCLTVVIGGFCVFLVFFVLASTDVI